MGGALTYLADSAVTTVKTDEQSWPTKEVEAGAASMQGWRRSMEDAHFMEYNEERNVYLFGVFDGHGGSGVSRYCAQRMPELVFNNENFRNRNFDIALHEAFMDIDSDTQKPEVQEELFKLHIDSKYTTSLQDRKKVEIYLSFETILDLFLGDPNDPANSPADPFKVFLDEYVVPNPLNIPIPGSGNVSVETTEPVAESEDQPPLKKRKRRGYDRPSPVPQFTAEPHSPWGVLASKIRQLIVVDKKTHDGAEIVSQMKFLVTKFASEQLSVVPALIRLRSEISWKDTEALLSDPLPLLFEGKLAALFHPLQGHLWTYSIHPIDLMALLNNDHLVESAATAGFRRCVSDDQGCTANVCLLALGGESPILYCANAGDSRAIVVRSGKAIPLSIDHKPSLPGERRRVLHAGGKVVGKADPRVQGDLNLSRAIGDWRHKQNSSLPLELQMISPRPDITITELKKEDEFIVLGCDGIWERFSSADCASFISDLVHPGSASSKRRSLAKHSLPEQVVVSEPVDIARRICEDTVRKGFEFPGVAIGVTIGCDNMSVIVVRIHDELRSAIKSEDALSSSSQPTLPVISYGAQVPEDWKPLSTGPGRPRKNQTPPIQQPDE